MQCLRVLAGIVHALQFWSCILTRLARGIVNLFFSLRLSLNFLFILLGQSCPSSDATLRISTHLYVFLDQVATAAQLPRLPAAAAAALLEARIA